MAGTAVAGTAVAGTAVAGAVVAAVLGRVVAAGPPHATAMAATTSTALIRE
ncbi:MAG: hypothetical protein ABIP53_01385 [Candidatus Limnocylindrales bacterium]